MKNRYRVLFSLSIMLGFSACSWHSESSNIPANKIATDAVPANYQTATVFNQSGEPVAPLQTAEAQSIPKKPMMTEGVLGGSVARSMDSLDKSKMITALDKGIGKTSKWSNPVTNTNYKVTPIKKVMIQGNTCREYAISAEHDDNISKYIGTACLGDDGNWKPIVTN